MIPSPQGGVLGRGGGGGGEERRGAGHKLDVLSTPRLGVLTTPRLGTLRRLRRWRSLLAFGRSSAVKPHETRYGSEWLLLQGGRGGGICQGS